MPFVIEFFEQLAMAGDSTLKYPIATDGDDDKEAQLSWGL